MDLYERLGVARDATTDQIKKAFRKLARQYHPDVGGDAGKFNEIAVAQRVLTDDDARSRYDQTGEIDEKTEVHPDAAALGIIGGLVDHITQQIVTSDHPERIDFAEQMRRQIDEKREALKKDQDEARKFERKATAVRKRFKVKSGDDYVGRMLDQRIEKCREAVESAERNLADMTRAAEILDVVEFDVEKVEDDPNDWLRNSNYEQMRKNFYEQVQGTAYRGPSGFRGYKGMFSGSST